MKVRHLMLAAGAAAILGAAPPAGAGGGGPLVISRLHGRVEIRPMKADGHWGRWRRARTGELLGTYLLRTGPRSWAHLEGGRYCVDSGSLLYIDSAADYMVRVVQGQMSAVDGRRGRKLPDRLGF